MQLALDRMEVEERGGTDPVRLAAAIHRQLGESDGPVPVSEIARALDIVDIREAPLRNVEGVLVTGYERDFGSILVNSRSSTQRRRYSVAHELLHFLNPLHEQAGSSGFACTAADMAAGSRSDWAGITPHKRQEIEANRFAIELLAPEVRMKSFLRASADLEHALGAAKNLDISKQAATRRYVELHRESLAVVFSKDGRVSYPDWGRDFPMLAIGKDDRLPGHNLSRQNEDALSTMDETDADLWLRYPKRTVLYSQSYAQADGHKITLLLAEVGEAEEMADDR